ncbi:2,4-dienoyl-CoA reductase-like NADH-dependent reductase (Old Yellow Enzyme family) [Rhodoligotrophos appendicifer]|uniref:NADH:flavin oxidoreductase/NADH oxidase n=1 Tax=Rhodoligotrophos appendicifer TaxID=987056 RepID=UPI001186AB2F|nr:NADH:flavin oxidoreductase/NADH oxidase [Rhodoligotrophos appendicifer]
MTAALFSPFTLRGMTVANRIAVSPMCQYSAVDGSATDWHLMHYGKFALAGAGLVILEATHVEARGRITHGCLGLYSDENEAALARVLAFCRQHGTGRIGMQLSHSGRKGSACLPWENRGRPLSPEAGGWQNVAPSAIAYDAGWPEPLELDEAGIAEVTEAHVQAVRRAVRLGIDLIEVHIAHGYLLHSFLSPLTNQRRDRYGGSLDNRMRVPLAVFRAMRAAWPAERPMGVRLTTTDWVEGGWTPEDSDRFAQALAAEGCDYLTASSGGTSPAQVIPVGEGHQVAFATRLRHASGLPTMAVGMIQDPHHAEAIIASGHADFVALARGMLHDPHWPWFAAATVSGDVSYPPQYIRAYRSEFLRERRRAADTSL